jgi:hypothetical protein
MRLSVRSLNESSVCTGFWKLDALLRFDYRQYLNKHAGRARKRFVSLVGKDNDTSLLTHRLQEKILSFRDQAYSGQAFRKIPNL